MPDRIRTERHHGGDSRQQQHIELDDFYFEPDKINMTEGEKVGYELENEGAAPDTLTIRELGAHVGVTPGEKKTDTIPLGAFSPVVDSMARIDLFVPPDRAQFECISPCTASIPLREGAAIYCMMYSIESLAFVRCRRPRKAGLPLLTPGLAWA